MDADEARDLEDSFFVRRAGLDAASNAKHAAGHGPQDDHEHDHAAIDPRTAQKMSAEAHARRQHLSRYVKWTVGVSAALLLLGVGRVAFKGKQEIAPPPPIVHSAFAAQVDTTPHSIAQDPNAPVPPQADQTAHQATQQEESQAAADQAVAALDNPANAAAPAAQAPTDPAAQAAQPAAIQPAAIQPAAAPVVADKPADPTPAVQPAAPLPAPVAAPAAAPSDKTAAQEKAASTKALERGNAKSAIEAGERSVALDATDGEAWLILGAAYQQAGKNVDAKRCFNACIKEGKKGPIGECRAMLQ